MNLRSDARDASVLVRTELRARARHIRGQTRQLVGLGFMTVLFGLVAPAMALTTALNYGNRLASDTVPVGDTGALLVGVAGAGIYLGSATAVQQSRLGSVGPLVRTSIPPTAVVVGRFTSETVQGILFVVPTTVALLSIVAVGAGGVLAPLALVLAGLPLLLATILVGRLLGDVLRYVDRRFGISTWMKAVALLILLAVAFLGSQTLMARVLPSSTGVPAASVPAFLPGTPLQAYASVALGLVGAPVRFLGIGVAVTLLAAIPLGFLATIRFERALLELEPAQERDPAAMADESREVPRPFRLTPATRVAWRYLLRTRRDPAMLSHLFPLAIGVLSFGATFFSSPEMATDLGPGALVVVGAALSGGMYCLNPLGDDRDQLALVLTSVRSPDVMLRGRAVAGVAAGLAFAWGLAIPLGLVAGDPVAVLARTLFAPLLLAAGAGTALGMGALVPKFERSEYVSVERAHPSVLITMAYLIGAMVVGIVGLLLVGWVAGSPTLAHGAFLAVYIAVVVGIAVGGYLVAVARFDDLTMDDL